MPLYIYRKRQWVGFVYALVYIALFIYYVVYLEDDQSWVKQPKFTIAVTIWFILSFAVKVSMFMNRTVELLNLVAVFAFLSIGFFYIPRPDQLRPIEAFCFYLQLSGGTICDVCDFIYEAVSKRSDD